MLVFYLINICLLSTFPLFIPLFLTFLIFYLRLFSFCWRRLWFFFLYGTRKGCLVFLCVCLKMSLFYQHFQRIFLLGVLWQSFPFEALWRNYTLFFDLHCLCWKWCFLFWMQYFFFWGGMLSVFSLSFSLSSFTVVCSSVFYFALILLGVFFFLSCNVIHFTSFWKNSQLLSPYSFYPLPFKF